MYATRCIRPCGDAMNPLVLLFVLRLYIAARAGHGGHGAAVRSAPDGRLVATMRAGAS